MPEFKDVLKLAGSHVEVLAKLRKAGVRHIVAGSYGIRHLRPIHDIDAVVHPADWKKLMSSGMGSLMAVPPPSGVGYRIKADDMDVDLAPNNLGVKGFDYKSLKREGVAKDEHGNEHLKPEQIARWKKAMGRPKDLADLKLIAESMKTAESIDFPDHRDRAAPPHIHHKTPKGERSLRARQHRLSLMGWKTQSRIQRSLRSEVGVQTLAQFVNDGRSVGHTDPVVKTALDYLPHQRRAVDALKDSHGVIMYHGLGSGKTLTSILAGSEYGGANVIVPASLQENYRKEVSKSKSKQQFNIMSYEGFARNPPKDIADKALVIDEAHRLRNPSGTRAGVIGEAAARAKKVLLLTGTPIQNKPHELAALVNLASGRHVLPTDENEFKKRFLGTKRVPRSFGEWISGKTPEYVPVVKNEKELQKALKGHISYYQPAPDIEKYPLVSHENVPVEMHQRQARFHKLLYDQLNPFLKYKIKHALPPEKQDIGALNHFLNAARQISNTTEAFDSHFQHEHATKINEVAKRIRESPGNSVAYSNYLHSGVLPLSRKLNDMGIPHLAFTGEVSKNDRKKAVEMYNKGKIKALILSSAGGEGLDLKGTRTIHIMEPHWHEEKVNQVVGRGARYLSHSHLPEEHRNVKVFHYVAKLPKHMFGATGNSADEYLQEMGKHKKKINQVFLDAAQRGSVEKAAAESGSKSNAWKGNAAGYRAKHIRTEESRGAPSKCSKCGTTSAKKFEWAKTGDGGYSRMCTSCHHKKDGLVNNLHKKSSRSAVINYEKISALAMGKSATPLTDLVAKKFTALPYERAIAAGNDVASAKRKALSRLAAIGVGAAKRSKSLLDLKGGYSADSIKSEDRPVFRALMRAGVPGFVD
jgi:superfamily II DNA or RNA helicase